VKHAFFKMAGILALAFMAAPQVVRAQDRLLVNVPFAFTAGKTMLPAGEYVVAQLPMSAQTLAIKRADGSAQIYVPSLVAEARAPQTESKLIFHRYGNSYFLSQIWVAGEIRGQRLPKSEKEEEMALAARNQKQEDVTIVALLTPHKP
jgi:hypothetical protein